MEGGWCESGRRSGRGTGGGGDWHRGVGSAARTESDVLERVGLIRLDADLQVGLGVAEGGLCVGRVGVESVERGERRGGAVDPRGEGPPNLTTQIFATSGVGGTIAVARVPGDHSSLAICKFVYSVVPPGTASARRSREVRGGGAGAGQSGRHGASFRRWEAHGRRRRPRRGVGRGEGTHRTSRTRPRVSREPRSSPEGKRSRRGSSSRRLEPGKSSRETLLGLPDGCAPTTEERANSKRLTGSNGFRGFIPRGKWRGVMVW